MKGRIANLPRKGNRVLGRNMSQMRAEREGLKEKARICHQPNDKGRGKGQAAEKKLTGQGLKKGKESGVVSSFV